MAGEWLKFESSLPEKPETLAITVAMGWDDPDLTVGKLMRLFRWFDQHTVDGNASSVTPALLDRLIGVTGFVKAVANTGWLVITEAGLTLHNFDRHNGMTAKNRAQTAKRVANHRASEPSNAVSNAETVTEPLAREEKRREEKKEHTEPSGSVPARKARGQRRCPETFVVSDEMRGWARASAPRADVERETMKFRNHEFVKARSDWMATWQNWILRADESATTAQGRAPPESFRAQEQRLATERIAEASPRIARRMNPNPTFDFVDMETPDAPRLA